MKTATMIIRERGKLIYNLYKTLTSSLSPLIHLHLRFRKFRGLEHPFRWRERFGHPSLPRPNGPLLWFHAVSLGEGMAAIPVIRRCLLERPELNILMTTTTLSAFEVLKHQLPSAVIYQFAPLDLPAAVGAFLSYWKPDAVILLESELWPNVVMAAAEREIGASTKALKGIEDLKSQLCYRPVWMASSVHKEEFEVMIRVHKALLQGHQKLLTVFVPRHPQHGSDFCEVVKKQELTVAVRSSDDEVASATSIYVVDTLGELRDFYRIMPITVIGGSFQPNLAGHNISEAMVAGCAVVTGPHVGHFSHMVSAMQSVNPSSILQVSGEKELREVLLELLSDPIGLEVRQSAAKQTFHVLSSGVLSHVWIQLNWFILRRLPL